MNVLHLTNHTETGRLFVGVTCSCKIIFKEPSKLAHQDGNQGGHVMKLDRELISNGNPMEAVVGFSRAVRVGPFVTIGGTAPVGPDGKTVGIGDVAAQTRQCIEIIKAALEQAGAGLHHVVRTRVILTDIDTWKQAIDVRKEYFRDVRPVDAIMVIDRFVNPEWLVELEADAIISS